MVDLKQTAIKINRTDVSSEKRKQRLVPRKIVALIIDETFLVVKINRVASSSNYIHLRNENHDDDEIRRLTFNKRLPPILDSP